MCLFLSGVLADGHQVCTVYAVEVPPEVVLTCPGRSPPGMRGGRRRQTGRTARPLLSIQLDLRFKPRVIFYSNAAGGRSICGWINAYGPAFEEVRETDLLHVQETAVQLSFREAQLPGQLKGLAEAAWGRWQAFCVNAPHSDRQREALAQA